MKIYLVTFLTTLSLFANNSLLTQINSLENLTLIDALQKLKKQNIELKVAAFATKIKEHEAKMSSAHHWGSLDLQENVMNSDDAGNAFGFKLASREVVQSDFITTTLNNPESRQFYQTKLTYKLPLFVAGKISAGSEISKALRELSALDGKALKFKKVYELRKSFYDIALLKAFIVDLNKIQSNLDTIESVTRSMIKEGYAKKIDLLEVKSKKASTQRLLTQSEGNLKLALEYVSFLLNEVVASIDTSSLERLSLVDKTIDVKELTFVKKAALGAHISKELTTVANAGFFPTIGAFAEFSSADDTFTGSFSDHGGYTVGVQLNWNLFNGISTINESQKARVQVLKSNQELLLAQKGLSLKINSLKTQIRSLGAELISLEAELEFQEQIVKNYRDRYVEKLTPITDVMRAESIRIQKVLEYKKIRNENSDKILQLHMLTQGL